MAETMTLPCLALEEYELTDLFAMRQRWSKNALFKRNRPRRSTGIIFLNECSGRYMTKAGEELFAPQKSVVCLPMGSEYSVLNTDCTETLSDAILIEFNIVQNGRSITLGDKPFRIETANTYLIAELAEETVRSYDSPVRSPAMVKANVYRLLSELGAQNGSRPEEGYQAILPAVRILEKDPGSTLSVRELAELCHVSESSFRRHFKRYSGKTPVEYKLDLKLEIAKRMLNNGDATSERIAEALGFESGAYFCRLFKKKTGLTPKQYKART